MTVMARLEDGDTVSWTRCIVVVTPLYVSMTSAQSQLKARETNKIDSCLPCSLLAHCMAGLVWACEWSVVSRWGDSAGPGRWMVLALVFITGGNIVQQPAT